MQRISQNKETFHTVSSFLVEKAVSGSLGEIQSVRKFCSGDLLVEVTSREQSQQILKLKALGTIPVFVTAHTFLNTCKEVITCVELLHEIAEKNHRRVEFRGSDSCAPYFYSARWTTPPHETPNSHIP
ncbi:hypothetical protein AVEN_270926-1 [Araneus ventricosus]|uniref:Uncharacterized protein n=1 Tax=Araneus ventricosus TaxID=182803 RepID=A0A4Y2R8F2_ARAVE|nr:hypothetical protein AVEN_270926-1 [Araneus ventricosus]